MINMVAVIFGTVTLVKYQKKLCILQERFISISILKLSSFLLVNMANCMCTFIDAPF